MFENLLKDHQKQDANRILAENSHIQLDTQRLYKHRYD